MRLLMHELGVTDNMLKVVLDHAKKSKVRKVVAVHLEIGELRDFEDKWIQHYFNYLSKDTLADSAELKVNRIPVALECNECKSCFNVKIRQPNEIRCPQCKCKECTLVSGNEYRVKHIEVI